MGHRAATYGLGQTRERICAPSHSSKVEDLKMQARLGGRGKHKELHGLVFASVVCISP